MKMKIRVEYENRKDKQIVYNIILSITTIIILWSTDAKLFQQVLKCAHLVHQ